MAIDPQDGTVVDTTSSPRKGRRPNVDWDAVRAEYESTSTSLRELASPHGITETAIRKRARKGGWVRGGITATKRRIVEERMLEGSHAEGSQEVRTSNQKVAAIRAAADHDAEFMLRVARAAEASVRNSERILAVANEALDKSGTMDWAERSETIKEGDGETNGNSTTTTTKTAGKFDLAFDAGKCTKIATEALQIARKTYALARGLEDGTEGVNVNVQANAQAGAQAAAVAADAPIEDRMAFYRSAAERALTRAVEIKAAELTPPPGNGAAGRPDA